jgi:hydroxypyruvate isomerase
MLKYAVNISMIGHPRPLAERIRLVGEAGFRAVEFWFPHQFDMAEMRLLTREYGLEVALFDLEPSESHPYGHHADPDPAAETEFFSRLDDAFRLAEELGCRTLNVLQGQDVAGAGVERQLAVSVDRLGRAAALAEREGILLCVEAINTIDRPGSFCHNTVIGTRIVEAVGSPWLRFQYDAYHMQLMEGNLVNTIRANIDAIGHVQFADPPGRNEPGTGEVNFDAIVRTLEELGYDRWVSLEYWASDPDGDPFAWLPREQRGR